ncbi:MAG: hypothetical protein WKF84_21920 [Pyrinomonadaceae bacterium]
MSGVEPHFCPLNLVGAYLRRISHAPVNERVSAVVARQEPMAVPLLVARGDHRHVFVHTRASLVKKA